MCNCKIDQMPYQWKILKHIYIFTKNKLSVSSLYCPGSSTKLILSLHRQLLHPTSPPHHPGLRCKTGTRTMDWAAVNQVVSQWVISPWHDDLRAKRRRTSTNLQRSSESNKEALTVTQGVNYTAAVTDVLTGCHFLIEFWLYSGYKINLIHYEQLNKETKIHIFVVFCCFANRNTRRWTRSLQSDAVHHPLREEKNWSKGDISTCGVYRVVRGDFSTSDLFTPRASVSGDNGIKNWFH